MRRTSLLILELALALLLFSPQSDASEGSPAVAFTVGGRHEDGVSTRGYGRIGADLIAWAGRLTLHPAVAFNAWDQRGVGLLAIQARGKFKNARSFLLMGYEHERWSGWEVVENRASLSWRFLPRGFFEGFEIDTGFGYRAPQAFAAAPSGEVFLAYRIRVPAAAWRTREEAGFLEIATLVFNYDQNRLSTMDHFQLAIETLWHPTREGPRFEFQGGVGAKGVSGGVLSWGPFWAQLGVAHAI